MTVSSTASPVTPEAINRVVKLTAPTRASGGKKDCKFCKPAGYKFLPLRYAVICGVDATQASMWPELTYPLGAGVVEQKLARSRYTVRMLREGFLYVLVSRTSGAMDWQGYAVTAGGMLASFPVGKPPVTPPVFTCDLSTEGVGASMVSIERIEEVKSIHVLFTPDVLPVEMLEKREKDKLGMQSMPKVWKGQPHALDAHALKQWVAEFKLNTDGMSAVSSTDPKLTARAPLARQLFPLMGGPGEDKPLFDEHGKRLSALVKQLEELKSCGFVLWDAIGITQELNQWHRHIADEINVLLKAHEREVEISNRIMGLKAVIEAQASVKPASSYPDAYRAAKIGTPPEYAAWARDPVGWAKTQKKAAWATYDSCYDEPKRVGTMNLVQASITPQFPLAEQRFVDLDTWLTSRALLDAFAHYSPTSVECGLLFHTQVSLCTYALATSESGEKRLRAWRADVALGHQNLMARQMLFNQEAAIAEVRQALSKLKGPELVDGKSLQTTLSNTMTLFDKANDMAALANEGQLPPGAAGNAAKLLSAPLFVSAVGQSVFTGINPAADKLYAFLIYMRAGARSFLQGMADAVIGVFDAIYPSKAGLALQEAPGQRMALQQAMQSKRTEFASLHFGAAIAVIEGVNLYYKHVANRSPNANGRTAAELFAAYAATAGATSIALANLAKLTKNGAKWIEHLKLTNGGMGGFVAGVMAWENAVDLLKAVQNRRYAAAFLFGIKAGISGLVAVGSLSIGALYSAPFLARVGQILGDNRLGSFAISGARMVTELAAKEILIAGINATTRVVVEALVAGIGWLLLAEQVGEIAVSVLSDNKLQVWLTRCTFHRPADAYKGLFSFLHDSDAGKPYVSLDAELKAFGEALSGAT
jgi:hypothetical protein